MKHAKVIGSSIVAIIGVAAVGAALASASGGATKAAKAVHAAKVHKAAARETPAATDGDTVQQGDQTSPDAAATQAKAADATGATDGDSVQQGDQTTPDTGQAARSESTGEASSESAPSDGPGGFADTSATANTQQQGEH